MQISARRSLLLVAFPDLQSCDGIVSLPAFALPGRYGLSGDVENCLAHSVSAAGLSTAHVLIAKGEIVPGVAPAAKQEGLLAWWTWGIVHFYFLIGLGNRLAVAMSGLWIDSIGRRSARLITQADADEPETEGWI